MLCSKCKKEMKRVLLKNYKYKESGLDNVILQEMEAYECPKCGGKYPILVNISGLHKAIAANLVRKKSLLSGKELAFLRKEMRLKAIDLARISGLTNVTISRYENEKENINPAFDRLVRMLYESRVIQEKCEGLEPKKASVNKAQNLIRDIRAICSSGATDLFKDIKNSQEPTDIFIPLKREGRILKPVWN